MGFIAELAKAAKADTYRSPGQRTWQRIFGSTTKEEVHDRSHAQPNQPRGTGYGHSLATNAGIVRLLQAMRSGAPGAPSDDRWEQSRHFVGIQYAAIHRTCEQMAQAEFTCYQRDNSHPKGRRPLPHDHPFVQVLTNPNSEDSFGDLMYQWSLQMSLTGSALTWMVPNKLKEPFELYVVPTGLAVPMPTLTAEYPNGYWQIQPVYPYGPFSSYPTPNSAVGARIPAEWMMRMKYPHPYLRYDGYSPMTALRLHIDEVESMDRSRFYSMKRGIKPSAVLQFVDMDGQQALPDEEIERIIAQYEQDAEGPENHGRLYVGTPGAELQPWGPNPIDMDYQGGWEQLVGFVMGAGFGITKAAAGMIEDAAYATLFATLKQFHLLTLGPQCARISNRINKTIAPFYGNDLFCEVRCPRIDDHDIKFTELQLGIQGQCLTKNEMREKLGWNPTSEKWGDDIAGSESLSENQKAEQQELMQQQAALAAPPGGGAEDTGAPGGLEEPEAKTRPTPGGLGKGSLGPRSKSMRELPALLHKRGYAPAGTADLDRKTKELERLTEEGLQRVRRHAAALTNGRRRNA